MTTMIATRPLAAAPGRVRRASRRASPMHVPTIKAQAALDAVRVLDTVWRPELGTLPVDPFWIARRFGILLRTADLGPDIAVGVFKDPGRDPRIVVNARDSEHRRAVSCAHAFGHYLRAPDADAFEYADRREIFAAEGDSPDEVYANAFADALLLPEPDVRGLHHGGWSEVDLPARFGVPREVVVRRLRTLGLG